MRKKLFTLLLLSTIAHSGWAVSYDQNITAIFGSGNPNTGWTTDAGIGSGIVLGLRAKNRTTGDTSNVNGVYSYATAPATRGLWNYEFSINSGTPNLDAYDFYLAVDGDSSQGISYTTVNPLSYWLDNSYGNNGTLQGQGVEGTDALASANNLAQNSQNITFGDYPGGAQTLFPNATYNYNLFAVTRGAGVDGSRLADVSITVVVGQGGSAVPDAGSTLALMSVACAGIAGLRRQFAA